MEKKVVMAHATTSMEQWKTLRRPEQLQKEREAKQRDEAALMEKRLTQASYRAAHAESSLKHMQGLVAEEMQAKAAEQEAKKALRENESQLVRSKAEKNHAVWLAEEIKGRRAAMLAARAELYRMLGA